MRLEHHPALDARALLPFLAARAVPGVEEVVDGVYRRSLPDGILTLRPGRDHVAVDGPLSAAQAVLRLDADPDAILARLGGDALLGPLVRAAPGRRIPGHPDRAELAVRALLGQQVSVAAARTLAGRLVAMAGEPLEAPVGGITRRFPTAAALAALDPEALPMPRARGRSLVELAAAVADGLDPRDRAAFLELRGIGPWTADYVAMRCGDPDVLLETDLGVRRGFARLGDPAALARRAEAWRPWRSYAVQHLWSLA